MAENAPKIKIIKIKVDKIKEIIGPSGKVIKDICESSSSKIDIDDNGVLKARQHPLRASLAFSNPLASFLFPLPSYTCLPCPSFLHAAAAATAQV